jgi:hypothetical protein
VASGAAASAAVLETQFRDVSISRMVFKTGKEAAREIIVCSVVK